MARYPTEDDYRLAIHLRITETAARSGWRPEQITKQFAARQLGISPEMYMKQNAAFGISHEDVQNRRVR